MDTYDSLFPRSSVLNEQIAQEVFETLPEGGPIMAIMDKEGKLLLSDAERFSKLCVSESFLQELCEKIDDGAEPVVTQANDSSIIAVQLVTEQTNLGYLIVALPQYSPESTLINIDLVETLLNQAALIARLLEKCKQLQELQMKLSSVYGQATTESN